MASLRPSAWFLVVALVLGCRSRREPALYNGHGLSNAPPAACAEFRVDRVDKLARVASPSVVGPNTRAIGAVTASTVERARAGDIVWVDYDRNGPQTWKPGDHGTLELDADLRITRILPGLMPSPCPPPGP